MNNKESAWCHSGIKIGQSCSKWRFEICIKVHETIGCVFGKMYGCFWKISFDKDNVFHANTLFYSIETGFAKCVTEMLFIRAKIARIKPFVGIEEIERFFQSTGKFC